MDEPSLTEFLLARVAEDEARHLAELMDGESDPALEASMKKSLAWQMAQVGFATRRFLAHQRFINRVVAAAYSDHPDYRDEWRP